MPDVWYYGRNDQRYGPLKLAELCAVIASGKIKVRATDLVWSPGMEDWTPASDVDILFAGTSPPASSPPPPGEGVVAEDRWHYEQQGERQSPVSFAELERLAAVGRVLRDNLVWKRGMADWTPAGEIEGLFPAQQQPTVQPAVPSQQQPTEPPASCGDRHLWIVDEPAPARQPQDEAPAPLSAAAEVEGLLPAHAKPPAAHPARQGPPPPSLQEQWKYLWDSTAAAATKARTNLARFRKFVHRQHLGTRLRLLIAATARGINWCYNAARPQVVRGWKNLRGFVGDSWRKILEMAAKARAERERKAADKAQLKMMEEAARKVAQEVSRLEAVAERKAAEQADRNLAEEAARAKAAVGPKSLPPDVAAARPKPQPVRKPLPPDVAAAVPKPRPPTQYAGREE